MLMYKWQDMEIGGLLPLEIISIMKNNINYLREIIPEDTQVQLDKINDRLLAVETSLSEVNGRINNFDKDLQDMKLELNDMHVEIGDITKLTTPDKTDLVSAINSVQATGTSDPRIGDLGDLTTTDKSSVVGAINEANNVIEVSEWNSSVFLVVAIEIGSKLLYKNDDDDYSSIPQILASNDATMFQMTYSIWYSTSNRYLDITKTINLATGKISSQEIQKNDIKYRFYELIKKEA